jgi:hypothetical protein
MLLLVSLAQRSNDAVSELDEQSRRESFGENVSDLLVSGYPLKSDELAIDLFTNEVMLDIDMLAARMEGVSVGHRDGALVVAE